MKREILALNGGYVNCGSSTNPDFREHRTFAPGDRFVVSSRPIEICQGRIEPRSIAFKPTALYLNGSFGAWQVHDVRVNERSQLDGDEFSGEVFSQRRHREMHAIASGFDTVRGAFEVEVSFLGGGKADRAPFYAAVMGLVVEPDSAVDAYSGAIRLRGLDGQLVTASCDGPSRVLLDKSAWFVARSDQAFRPVSLAIDRYSQDWMIVDVRVDGKSQFVQAGVIPGDLFHPDTLDCFATFNVVPAGGSFAIKAHYVGSNPRGGRFGAVVCARLDP
jgi:hypothetical protein